MLGGRKSPQCPIKDSPRFRDFLLLCQKLHVVDPDTWHLVHEDQTALETVIDLVITGVRDASAFYLLPPHLIETKTLNKENIEIFQCQC